MPPRTLYRVTRAGVIVIIIGVISILVFLTYLIRVRSVPAVPPVNLKQMLAVSIEVARRGGNVVREVRVGGGSEVGALGGKVKGKTREGANEFVTIGDMLSHRVMRNGFNKAFPGITVISEEHDDEADAAQSADTSAAPSKDLREEEASHIRGATEFAAAEDVTVWIDPLDATQEYTENLTEYVTTMVCVAVKGVPVIGVIHNPFDKTTAWAWVSHGTSPELLKASDPARNERLKYRIIVSRSHAGSIKALLANAFEDKVETVPAGGAGYKVLAVLRGQADAYLHVTNIKKWDVCAGNALLDASYGRMTTLRGELLDFSSNTSPLIDSGLIATVGDNVHGLHGLFLQHWAKANPV